MIVVRESLRRIGALALRYAYLHRRSIPRIMEIFFWPFMNLMVWGFLSLYMRRVAVPGAVTYLVGAVIFWDILYRSQQAVSLTITEELWARNIINLFIAPLHTSEIVAAACLVGLAKALLTTIFMAGLALPLYGFDVLDLGGAFLPLYANLLLFGWSVGMITMALVFRYGRAAEALIWGIPFLIQPLSAVFYPVDVLPMWLQPIARGLPSTWVFEGMRRVLDGGEGGSDLLWALGLNLAWLIGASRYFSYMLQEVRKRGYLSRQVVE